MGVASLVLGILAVLIGIFSSGVLGWLGAIMAIIGVVMGALGGLEMVVRLLAMISFLPACFVETGEIGVESVFVFMGASAISFCGIIGMTGSGVSFRNRK